MSDKLTEFSQKAECNKYFALGGVFFALLLSCGLICFGLYKYNSEKPIATKTIETKNWGDKPACDTACCMLSHKVEKTPVEIAETDYDNTAYVLLYVSIMIFMFLSLGGAFTILLKVLKSEHEMNSKILAVELDIYKEKRIGELIEKQQEKGKDKAEKNNSRKPKDDASGSK